MLCRMSHSDLSETTPVLLAICPILSGLDTPTLHPSASLRHRVVAEPAWVHLWGFSTSVDPSGRKTVGWQLRSEQMEAARDCEDQGAVAASSRLMDNLSHGAGL